MKKIIFGIFMCFISVILPIFILVHFWGGKVNAPQLLFLISLILVGTTTGGLNIGDGIIEILKERRN